MSEIVRWGWRCVGHGCGAREHAPTTNEAEAARVAEEHSRRTGHRVAWGILQDNRLH